MSRRTIEFDGKYHRCPYCCTPVDLPITKDQRAAFKERAKHTPHLDKMIGKANHNPPDKDEA